MANKFVFASLAGRLLPKATATNAEGAKAYALGAEHKLAQLAMTGTFGGGFYQDAPAEVSALVAAAEAVEPMFLAQTAVHVRAQGNMKDTPALLLPRAIPPTTCDKNRQSLHKLHEHGPTVLLLWLSPQFPRPYTLFSREVSRPLGARDPSMLLGRKLGHTA